MEKIPVGIVGLGHNGVAHLQAQRELGRSTVVALCDRDPGRLAQAGQEADGAALYTDLDAFFQHPGMQAVSINTGDDAHREPFVKAVAAGKHVLVEKPVANRAEDLAAMAEAVAAADPGLKIQVGYILRFSPVFASVHHLARTQSLGEIYYMEADYVHNLLYQAEQTDQVTGRNWYLEEELPMVGGGSHPLDLLRWISGNEVARVWSYANHVAFPTMRHDDCHVALFQFTDGTIAKVAALYAPRCAMAPYCNLRIYGTKGTIERDSAALAQSAADVHPDFSPLPVERTEGHSYVPEIDDWLTAIREDRPPRCPFADGANSSLAALCAVQAAREGCEVSVPHFNPPPGRGKGTLGDDG